MMDSTDSPRFEDDFESARPRGPELGMALSRAATRAALFGSTGSAVAVDRYRIGRKLGSGAMGTVYAAHDPELDRTVALKFIGSAAAELDEVGRQRLVQEARAAAALSHPNIITIHAIAASSDRVYIAMEFIDGETLRAWMARPGRSWQDVARVFAPIAEGLAAAHAAGILHGDFKPDNVMIGADGRPKILDFGLATQLEELTAITRDVSGANPRVTAPRAGTPAYMAPEQLDGERVGASADQYSFCVALAEALGAELRPTPGQPPSVSGLACPRWLRRALRRGLARSSHQRLPDMSAWSELLAGPRRRGTLWLSGAVAVGAAGLWLWGAGDGSEHAPNRCDQGRARIATTWNPAAAGSASAAFEKTGLPLAGSMWTRVNAALDERTRSWAMAYDEACRNARPHGGTRDAAMACLERRRAELATVVDLLQRADAKTVRRALGAVSDATTVDECLGSGRDAVALDPAAESIMSELGEVRAYEALGHYREGVVRAESAVEQALALGDPELEARALYGLGQVLERAGNYDTAEDAFSRSYWRASEAGLDERAAAAAIYLVAVIGERKSEPQRGLQWARHARSAIARAALHGGADEAALLNNVGAVHIREGEYEKARDHFERAAQLWAETYGPDDPDVAAALDNAAAAASGLGRHKDALVGQQRALEIRTRVYGPDHPEVASSLHNIATVLNRMQRREEARPTMLRALRIRRDSLGPDHRLLAETLQGAGDVEDGLGHHDVARAYYQESLEIVQRVFGDGHIETAGPTISLGNVAFHVNDLESARVQFERGLAIEERHLGAGHPQTATVRINLAAVAGVLGRYEDSIRHYRAALEILEPTLGAEHPSIAHARTGLGTALLRRGDVEQAVVELGSALSTYEASDLTDAALADTRFTFAQALWATGRDRPRALSLARRARRDLLAVGQARASGVDEIDTWLRSIHRTP